MLRKRCSVTVPYIIDHALKFNLKLQGFLRDVSVKSDFAVHGFLRITSKPAHVCFCSNKVTLVNLYFTGNGVKCIKNGTIKLSIFPTISVQRILC